MKRLILAMTFMANLTVMFGQSKVYVTQEITPESLVRIYEALGVWGEMIGLGSRTYNLISIDKDKLSLFPSKM